MQKYEVCRAKLKMEENGSAEVEKEDRLKQLGELLQFV